MKTKTDILWNKISRIGLREEEDIITSREVILMNRILTLMLVVLCIYVPVELFLNGTELVPYVLMMMCLSALTMLFHHFRLFTAARYYLFTVGVLFISTMGLMVGKNVGNTVSFIPIVLFGIILFKKKSEKVIIFILVLSVYLVQHYLFGLIKPIYIISPKNTEIFSVIFFILAMLLTFIAGFYLMSTNKEYENIIIQHKEKIELKNKEITDSITYAKRIQTAILPADTQVKTLLPDSFIFYRPKDIVAGDFYWLEKKEGLIIFAAADCTGHGVPGAMVSVICNNALNRSVREYGLSDPGLILDRTRETVIAEFEKSDEAVKDGMDISLCCLDPKTLQLKWAGANNPLWIINENGLTEIKANKQPIGKFTHPLPYTTHSVPLKKGDLIYIFTDGFQDQFGGEKGKKFKASKLKELLTGIKHKSLSEQKQIIEFTFDQWKGDLEQIDDICMVGVRM